jgi:predicted HAD superfamily Cof-like phosphohydrolase
VEYVLKSNFEKVQEFHRAFGHPGPDKLIENPSLELIALRIRLIREEWVELLQEFESQPYDMAKVSKEMADLLYVIYGAADVFGIPIDRVFEEVHDSNMSKLGADGKPVYREDGKFMKGPNYRPADIRKVLYGEQGTD